MINEKAKAIKNEIAEISRSKMELEGKRTRADKEAQERNGDILDLERKVAKIEQKKLAADMEEKQIMDKLWENYELSHTAAQAMRQPVESLPKANKLIGELRRQINALGTPNLGAIDEFARVNERYEYLTGQRDDVLHAKDDLLQIIDGLTTEMTEIFVREFAKINEYFGANFSDVVNIYRINYATDLLYSTTLSVAEISKKAGYDSVRSFNRNFQKYKGKSPRDAREFVKEGIIVDV